MSNNAHCYPINIAVVIPCYKVHEHILNVLDTIPEYISKIYCIDDGCPENSGKYINENNNDERVNIIYHRRNKGVGAAMVSGYLQALSDNAEIIVKIDGDGQMNPSLISKFIKPIINNAADYTKGNRFFQLHNLDAMPLNRIFGNAALTFLNKLLSLIHI